MILRMSQKNQNDNPDSEWKWHYSGWTGIMYGPIPVGIILVVIGFIVYAVYTLTTK
jgi:hypothetical protein